MLKILAILVVLGLNGEFALAENCDHCRNFLYELYYQHLFTPKGVATQKKLLKDGICEIQACHEMVDSEWAKILRPVASIRLMDICDLIVADDNECEAWNVATINADDCKQHITTFGSLLGNDEGVVALLKSIQDDFCPATCLEKDVDCNELCQNFVQDFVPKGFAKLVGKLGDGSEGICDRIIENNQPQ